LNSKVGGPLGTIETPENEIDLYTPIKIKINNKAPIKTEITAFEVSLYLARKKIAGILKCKLVVNSLIGIYLLPEILGVGGSAIYYPLK